MMRWYRYERMQQPDIARSVSLLAFFMFALAPVFGAYAQSKPGQNPKTQPRKLCVFDPSGAHGDAFLAAQDYRIASLAQGVAWTLKPYTDEQAAASDLQAGVCDAAVLTGPRTRRFHRFASSIEAMGALASYEDLHAALNYLGSPKLAGLMRGPAYESLAMFPAGAVYLFLRDRKVSDVGDLAGKRIATLGNDPAAKTLVERVGASLALADVGTFAAMFNNGAVDACYAPAVAYGPLELHRGMLPDGGVVRLPLAQLMLHVVARSERFAPEFGAWSRRYVLQNFEGMLAMVRKAETSIPKDRWMEIEGAQKDRYQGMFRDVRLKLRGKDKTYHPVMLGLLRRVRCKSRPDHRECADGLE